MAYLDFPTYVAVAHKATQLDHVQRIRMALGHQVERFGMEDGLPPDFASWAAEKQKEMEQTETVVRRELVALMGESPIAQWVEGTSGLGPALLFILGLVPPLAKLEGMPTLEDGTPRFFANPAKLWRYCGLHPEGGKRREKGVKSGFSPRLKAYCIMRVAVPIEKHRESPYRGVYDARKARTMATHPEMLDVGCEFCDAAKGRTTQRRAERNLTRERTSIGFDCSALGGPHWSAGHRRFDALRVTAKAVLLDSWRVANGLAPRVVAQPHVPPMVGMPPSEESAA